MAREKRRERVRNSLNGKGEKAIESKERAWRGTRGNGARRTSCFAFAIPPFPLLKVPATQSKLVHCYL